MDQIEHSAGEAKPIHESEDGIILLTIDSKHDVHRKLLLCRAVPVRATGVALAFGACFDSQQHLPLHDEVDGLEQKIVTELRDRVGANSGSPPDNQSRGVLIDRSKIKPPGSRDTGIASQNQCSLRFKMNHRERWCLGMQPDVIPHSESLILREDVICIVHLAADQVLQPCVAVEATFVLPYLYQPGPDSVDARMNRNRVGSRFPGMGYDLVAGKRRGRFFPRRPPA